MNKATWDSLSQDDQQTWDQLTQQGKTTILNSRPGMAPRPSRSTPQGTPSSARPPQRPSALRSPPDRQQVEFHENADSVPTIGGQYETNFLEQYTVNNATQRANDTTVALSNDMHYKPKPSPPGECSIFNTITSVPRVTTPNEKSSTAGTGESSGSSDRKSLFRMPKLRAKMAVLLHSHTWEDCLAEEYDVLATSIHLPRHYSAWHSRIPRELQHRFTVDTTWQPIPRELRHRFTVNDGENAMRISILEWASKIQGTVSTATVAAEVLSHGVSMAIADGREEVDPWAGMRETEGTRRADGEPRSEGVGELPDGNEGGEEDNMVKLSTVDGGNNWGVSGPGMRLLEYVVPERRVDLYGFQGRVVNGMPIGSFASVVRLSTGEEALAILSEYAHDPRNLHAIHSTLQLTSHGMIVKDRSPRFGTLPSITTLEGDVIHLLFTDGIPMLQLRYPTDMEVMSLRRIYITGTDPWNPSRYDRPPVMPLTYTIPPSAVFEPAGLPPLDYESDGTDTLPPLEGDSDGTSTTQDSDTDSDTVDDMVDTVNIDGFPETDGQVSFNYREVINELEELWEYKKAVRHQLGKVFKELREVSIRGEIEGRLIATAFGDNYSQGVYWTVPSRQAPPRDDDGNIIQLPYGDNMEYNGSWTTFVLRNGPFITQARSDEIAHRHNVHQLMTGRPGNPRTKLNQRIRQLAFQHNMVKHLTKIIKSPWYGYTQGNAIISERTLVLHPTLVEFMRIHGFGSRVIAEGIMFGESDRFADMKIDMFGQMSNMSYVGPSFTCPKDVLNEFEIGKN